MIRSPLGPPPPAGERELAASGDGAPGEAAPAAAAPPDGVPYENPGGSEYRTRYPLLLRLFLTVFVFDMVVRSLIALTPYDGAWRESLHMERFPLALPTEAEQRKIASGGDRKFETLAERYQATLTSLLEFASPWPSDETLKELDDAADVGRYTAVWIGTRLNMLGALLGLDQNWPMFAPNVRTSRLIPRAQLLFEDGTKQQVWLLGEPWDLTDYSRWFIKRPLQIDIRLHQDHDARLGVSRHLARVFPVSPTGAPVRHVELHKVYYRLPAPTEDAYEVLLSQSRKPLADDPFWRYDVRTGRGRTLEDGFEKRRKERERKRKKARRKKSRDDRERRGAHKP